MSYYHIFTQHCSSTRTYLSELCVLLQRRVNALHGEIPTTSLLMEQGIIFKETVNTFWSKGALQMKNPNLPYLTIVLSQTTSKTIPGLLYLTPEVLNLKLEVRRTRSKLVIRFLSTVFENLYPSKTTL